MKKLLPIFTFMLLPTVSFAHEAPPIPEPRPLNELLSAFGWEMGNANITTEKVTDDLHVLFGLGGNIAVSTGKDGVLIVDDQFPQLMPKIKSSILCSPPTIRKLIQKMPGQILLMTTICLST